jgi:hypothetical protein
MSGSEGSSDTEEESETGALAGLDVDSGRRSVLKAAGAGLGLSALGGSAVSTAGAAHDSTTFQVDLVNSTPDALKDPLDETGNYYSDDSTLVRWVWGDDQGNTTEGGMTKYDGNSFDGATVTTQGGVSIDVSTNTATVDFSVSNVSNGAIDLTLVSYSTPSGASLGWDPSDASGQEVHDYHHDTFDHDGSLTVALPTKPNQVTNHGMESGDLGNDNPDSWDTETFGGSPNFTYVDAESRSGGRSIKIESTTANGADSNWIQTVPVDPTRSYDVSAWFKTDNVQNEGASEDVIIELSPGFTTADQNLTGTNPWTRQQGFHKPGSGTTSVLYRLKFGFGGKTSGTAWYDDAAIKELPGRISDYDLELYYSLDGATVTNNVTGTDAPTQTASSGATGLDGDAYSFTTNGDTGTGGDAITSESLPLNGQGATVAGWVYYTGFESYARIFQVGGSPGAGPTDGWNIEFSGSNEEWYITHWDGGSLSNDSDQNIPVSSDTWYFVVAVIDGTTPRLHVFTREGELDASPVVWQDVGPRGSTTNQPLHLMVGDGRDTAGRADEVRAYSRALTEREVWQLYQGTLDLANHVQAYYSLDGSTATNAITDTDGATTGSPNTGVTGIENSGWEFVTANGDGLESGSSLLLNGQQATVGAWVNFTDDGSGGIEKDDFARLFMLGGGGFSGKGPWQVRFDGGNDFVNIEFDAGTIADTDTLSPGTWYFIVAVIDDEANEGRIHVYDQSSELSSSPYTGSLDNVTWTQTGAETLYLMRGDGRTVSGTLDEVYAYGDALSASEVTSLYNDSTAS